MVKTFFVLIAVLIFFGSRSVFAQSAVQKAVENVKESLDNLVSVKDGGKSDELPLKIETLRNVIDLSLAEAKDLKAKLLAINDSEKNLDWQKKVINSLNGALDYYVIEKQSLDDNEDKITSQDIKSLASTFKTEREKNYLPQINEVRDFLLIKQEQNSIQTAEKRAQRISNDLRRLTSAKISGVSGLYKLLDKANLSIKSAREINNKASESFYNLYVSPIIQANSSSTTTSTVVITSVENLGENINTTSSPSSTALAALPPSPPSIKDLVKDSLVKIKDAYQTFIEMSSLVRKLLQ